MILAALNKSPSSLARLIASDLSFVVYLRYFPLFFLVSFILFSGGGVWFSCSGNSLILGLGEMGGLETVTGRLKNSSEVFWNWLILKELGSLEFFEFILISWRGLLTDLFMKELLKKIGDFTLCCCRSVKNLLLDDFLGVYMINKKS